MTAVFGGAAKHRTRFSVGAGSLYREPTGTHRRFRVASCWGCLVLD